MTVVVQEVVGKKRYLVRLEDGLEKDFFRISSPLWLSGAK